MRRSAGTVFRSKRHAHGGMAPTPAQDHTAMSVLGPDPSKSQRGWIGVDVPDAPDVPDSPTAPMSPVGPSVGDFAVSEADRKRKNLRDWLMASPSSSTGHQH